MIVLQAVTSTVPMCTEAYLNDTESLGLRGLKEGLNAVINCAAAVVTELISMSH
jgi:hypothetical protein